MIVGFGERASRVIATSFETEEMNVSIGPDSRLHLDTERHLLNRNLAEAARLRPQLDEILTDIERNTQVLRDLIDREIYEVRSWEQ